MAKNSKIEWTDHTFNPWWGCTKVSAECDHCYAETFARRVGFSETGAHFPIWGKDTRRRFFGDKHWNEPRKWNADAERAGRPAYVFCASMADVMEHACEVEPHRQRLYRLINDTPWLVWILLTKRPQNFRRYLPADWIAKPRPNVIGATTVGTQATAWRADELVRTPFCRRMISAEPLIGHVVIPTDTAARIDWIVAGGESGPGARPMHPGWVRSLFAQFPHAARLFKQWGEWQNGSDEKWEGHVVLSDGRHGLTPNDFDQETRNNWPKYAPAKMARVGKARAGRLLNGREWNEFPPPASHVDWLTWLLSIEANSPKSVSASMACEAAWKIYYEKHGFLRTKTVQFSGDACK